MFKNDYVNKLKNAEFLYVDVKFIKSNVKYTYVCPKDFKYKHGDIVKIYNFNNEPEEAVILNRPYSPQDKINLYKFIRICEETKDNEDKYLCVDVVFRGPSKVYTYICPKNFNHKKNEWITIYNVLNEPEHVNLVSNPYYLEKNKCQYFRVCREALDEIDFSTMKPSIQKKTIIPTRKYVDVKFLGSSKIYTYLCPKKFNYKRGENIKIDSVYGNEFITITREPYYAKKDDFAYKMLKVCNSSGSVV